MKKRPDVPPQMFDTYKDFIEATNYDLCQYRSPNDPRVLFKYRYDSKIAKYLGLSPDIQLFSIAGVEILSKRDDEHFPNKSVRLFIAFTNFNRELKYHDLLFPKTTKFARCPKNVEIFDKVYWDVENRGFLWGEKPVELSALLKKIGDRHTLPLAKVRGIFVRTGRRLLWTLGRPIGQLLTNFSFVAYRFLTGKSFSIRHEVKDFSLYQHRAEKMEVQNLADSSEDRIEFLGYRVSLQPIVAFSVVHVLIYSWFVFTKGLPQFYTNIIDVPALTVVYGVAAYAILYWGLGSFFRSLSILAFRLFEKSMSPKKKKYV